MPRKPTGRPRGRPLGSGVLGLGTQDDQRRLALRVPTALYARLEAFAAGRHGHRGSPQLARCVREALTEYLDRHTKRQTENIPPARVDTHGQTRNSPQDSRGNLPAEEHNKRQSIIIPRPLEQPGERISQPGIAQEDREPVPGAAPGADVKEARKKARPRTEAKAHSEPLPLSYVKCPRPGGTSA